MVTRAPDRLSCMFEIGPELDEIEPLWAEVEAELLIWIPLTDATRDRFHLALAEAVASAVLYGPSTDRLHVEVLVESGRLEARVHGGSGGFVLTETDVSCHAVSPPGSRFGLVQARAADVGSGVEAWTSRAMGLAVDWPSTRDLS